MRHRGDEVHCVCWESGKVRRISQELIKEVGIGRKWVSRKKLSTFCGVAISRQLAIPLDRVYTSSLYDGLGDWKRGKERVAGSGEGVRLSNWSVKNLRVWSGV